MKRHRNKYQIVGVCAFFVSLLIAPTARAFCGFFVSKADAKLYNSSSQVIIARSGNRSIFTMANNYQGDVKDFARIVPIPVVPKREQVRIGDNKIVEQLDNFTAPRLVQYVDNIDGLWDKEIQGYLWSGSILLFIGLIVWLILTRRCKLVEVIVVLLCVGILVLIALPSFLNQANKSIGGSQNQALGVKVEDKFTVGEYDVVILSAAQSNGLTTWLIDNGYKVPANAQAMLQAYIKQGMKFFVVRVNLEAFEKQGYGFLRPIVLDYESPKFMLPIRLGTLNATSDQDLIIHILTPRSFAEVANYKTVLIPTDNKSTRKEPSGEELPILVQDKFGEFYQTMFQREYEREGKNVAFLEYAGTTGKCDPCSTQPPTSDELKKAGAFWEQGDNFYGSYITRLHVRYNQEKFPQDLVFQEVSPEKLASKVANADKLFRNGAGVVFQGRYVIRRPQGSASSVAHWRYHSRWDNRWANNLAKLTGWDVKEIRQQMTSRDKNIAEAMTLNQEGERLANSGNHAEALVYYNKAIALDSSNSITLFNKGLALYKLGRYAEALATFEQVTPSNSYTSYAAEKYRIELRNKLVKPN